MSLLIGSVLQLSSHSQSIVGIKSTDKIKSIRIKAIFKIDVFKDNEVISRGTAFAINKKGQLVTAKHIIEEYLKHHKSIGPSYRIEVMAYNGRKFSLNANDKNCDTSKLNLDLCILELGVEAKYYIPINEGREPLRGIHIDPFSDTNSHHRFFTFGNPAEGYFRYLEYRLIRYHNEPKLTIRGSYQSTSYNHMTPLLDLTEYPYMKSTKGYSGAPLIDSRGRLVGVLSQSWERLASDKYVGQHKSSIAIPFSYISKFYLKYTSQ